jgi:hypothetical protein
MSARPQLNVIAEYYRTFPQEIACTDTLNVVQQVRVWNMTFETLVDHMTSLAKKGKKNFLVCEHGFWLVGHLDEPPVALDMRLAFDTTELSGIRAFEGLREMMEDDDADVKEIAKTTNVSAMILKRLHGKLETLRQLDLGRIEFRACGIGANDHLLDTLGFILNCDWIAAPDVDHMYYVHVNPGTPFRNLTNFENWRQSNPGTRLYEDDQTGVCFALRINAVNALTAHTLAACYTPPDVSDAWSSCRWWVENNIMTGSIYRGGPFPLSFLWDYGRAGPPFIFPLDADYSKHIKDVGPFRI